MDFQQGSCRGLRELALFAGAGGGILGGHLLGWRTVCAVEFDPHARDVLLARQNDGCIPPFPVWDDVRTFDGRPWRGAVDVVSGGFPCQDISCAGKGAGIDGERSGLWREMARIVGEVRPRYVFVENSPMLVGRGLAVVLGDLAALGYDARWGVVGAQHAIADSGVRREDHARDRIWIVAKVADADGERLQERQPAKSSQPQHAAPERRGLPWGSWWQSEPRMGGMADGLAAGNDQHGAHAAGDVGRVASGVRNRVHRLRCIGNGQVPAAAALAWRTLTEDQG